MHGTDIIMKMENKNKYYKNNADMIKFEARNKHKNISKEEKNKKRKYQRERYHIPS